MSRISDHYMYETWIYDQLEPDQANSHTGKSFFPKTERTMFAKWELEDREREMLGEEEYFRREQEWQEWERRQKENND